MKSLAALGILVLMFTGCTSAEYQRMQAERDQLLRNYEDVRQEHDEIALKTDITNTLLGKWKFLDLEVEESDVTEEIAAAKAALHALNLKHLTLEFFEEKGTHFYSGKRSSADVSGQFTITTVRYGDEPFPFIRFIRRSGPTMPQLLFAVGPDGKPLGLKGAQTFASAKANAIGISVTEDRLYFLMYGKMELSPNGWVQSGGLRCSFERIK